jgi:hypothetical protein
MPVRPEVRQAQRTIAALDTAHRQAATRVEEALARRAEAVADQDHLVSVTQGALERAVADMAHQGLGRTGRAALGLRAGRGEEACQGVPTSGRRRPGSRGCPTEGQAVKRPRICLAAAPWQRPAQSPSPRPGPRAVRRSR